MTKYVRLDARVGDSYVLQTYSRTTDRLWIGSDLPIKLNASVPDEELGTAVRQALDASLTNVERPADLNSLMGAVLKAAGVRSQRAYYKGTKSIGIFQDDAGRIEVEPNRLYQGGFAAILDRVISLKDPEPLEIASAIRSALEISESHQ